MEQKPIDPAYITFEDNGATKKYWLKNKLHREDGPAIECKDGSKFWFQNGERHRTDGPAVIEPNGNMEWWENGKRIKMTFKQLETLQKLPGASNPEYKPIKRLVKMGLAFQLPNIKTFQNPMYEITLDGRRYLEYLDSHK